MLGKHGTDATKTLLTQHPEITAIFAIHDERAIQAIQGAVDLGLNVPQDISIIGLDGSEEARSGFPKLTTVRVPHFEVGYLAAELLLKQVENENLYHGNLTVHSQLITGDSCSLLV